MGWERNQAASIALPRLRILILHGIGPTRVDRQQTEQPPALRSPEAASLIGSGLTVVMIMIVAVMIVVVPVALVVPLMGAPVPPSTIFAPAAVSLRLQVTAALVRLFAMLSVFANRLVEA